MGTAFSSSLLGLSGSLVLGFLELQASHAHTRFYNELEEWLSGITELTPGSSSATDQAGRQLMSAVFEMQRAVEDLTARLGNAPVAMAGGGSHGAEEPVRELARGVNQLVSQMRSEQKVVREWVDDQAVQQAEVASALKELAQNIVKKKG
jgi:hypothetical protein